MGCQADLMGDKEMLWGDNRGDRVTLWGHRGLGVLRGCQCDPMVAIGGQGDIMG